MYYAKIKKYDVSNGPGVRTSLYVSGCRHKCKGCFNQEAWDFFFGKPFTEETIQEIIDSSNPDFIEGLTIVGGEPLEPENQEEVWKTIQAFRKVYPKKTIWLFSGFLFEQQILKQMCHQLPYTRDILENIDVLVDGKFVENLKDPLLGFRGSSNQRIIDVPASLKQNKIILHDKQYMKEERNQWN